MNTVAKIVLLFELILSLRCVFCVEIDLPQGKLQGSVAYSFSGRKFYQFDGIPYAEPPVGPLRFQPPIPFKSWKGTWVADTVYECLQYNGLVQLPNGEYNVEGEEDCLYLNVYTTSLSPQKKMDVIVFIHGGAFMFSYGGFYRPKFIMDRDVVYVSINYRLGPLGFLSTEDNLVPGNNGFLDQVATLQWIKKYIKYFGGNPDSVTITGASAGGVSVHAHNLSPLSKGLFHKIICRSGTTIMPWGIMEAPLEKTKKLAAVVGCPTSIKSLMISCLKIKPAHQIVHAVRFFVPFLYNPEQPWALTVDTWALKPVFPQHPYLLLKNGKINDVPVIFSQVNLEGFDPGAGLYNNLSEINANFNTLMPYILEYNYTIAPSLKNEVGDEIRNFYFPNGQTIDQANFGAFIDALSQRQYLTGLYHTLDLQKAISKKNLYLYKFSYQGAQSLYPDIPHNGAGHYEDTPYVFGMASMDTTTTEEDRKVIELFLDMYASFAKNGKPTVPGIEWPPTQKTEQVFTSTGLVIDSPTDLTIQKLTPANWQFWESLPFQENENLFK